MKAAEYARFCELKRAQAKMNRTKPDGTFEGYASVFNQVDLGNDIIIPGAFHAALARRGPTGVRMLFQHDPAQPIGVWERLEETPVGLFARGRLALATQKGREVHELMRAGAIDGLSIGFRTIRAKAGSAGAARQITEADLWEVSVVTFPMQEQARITNVKRAAPQCADQFYERHTADDRPVRAGECSRHDARQRIEKGAERVGLLPGTAGDGAQLAAAIRAAAHRMNH